MTSNYNSAKLVIVVSTLVLLLGSLPDLGHGGVQPEATGLLDIVQIQYTALLVCTPTGNPPSSGDLVSGVVGAVISGSCNGAGGNISRALTNTTGFANNIITLADSIAINPSTGVPCFLTLQLPLIGTSCTLFPPTGILRAVLQLVSVFTNPAGGLVAVLAAGPWVHVAGLASPL